MTAIGYVLYQWCDTPQRRSDPSNRPMDHRHDDTPQFMILINFLRKNGRETMRLNVRATNTFREVKAQIQGIINVPANQQLPALLLMEGTLLARLEDDQKLSDYNIQDGGLLYLGLSVL